MNLSELYNTNGAGERAKTWLSALLTDLYNTHGSQMMNHPTVDMVRSLAPMIPGLGKQVSGFLSTLEKSGPAALLDSFVLSDTDAVQLMEMMFAQIITGYRDVLGVELDAE